MTHDAKDKLNEPGPRTLRALDEFKRTFNRELRGLKNIVRDELDEPAAEYFINWVEENIRDQGVEFFES